MIFDRVLQKLRHNKQIKKSGGYIGIPYPFPRLSEFIPSIEKGHSIGILAGTGVGKCLGKGTRVVMFDGSLKAVENIKVGDLLMGPDSKPRTVLSLVRGREQMYWVRQLKGLDYRVNESHIVSLRRTGTDEVVNIPVKEYLTKSGKFKHVHKGYKVGVDFETKPLSIDPYYLGLWLGDGVSCHPTSVVSNDAEIILYLQQYADQLGAILTADGLRYNLSFGYSKEGKAQNIISQTLRSLECVRNKHIPDVFLYNDKNNRLRLLAGLLDTDGYYNPKNNSFQIIQKNKVLADQIVFLSRSLGFYTSVREKNIKCTNCSDAFDPNYTAWVIHISGYLDQIPCLVRRKQAKVSTRTCNPLHTGITIEKDIVDDYYGFTIDGDHLFLLEDFTVTHNSKFTRFVFLYHIYKFHRSTGYPVKILYFPLEDNADKVYMNLICNYLHDQHGIVISPQELKSQRGTLPDFVESAIVEGYEYFKHLEEVVTFVDYLTTPKEIYEYCAKEAMKHGKKMKRVNDTGEEEFYYQPTDDMHLVVLLDNMSNLDTDPTDGCNSEREAMVKFAKDYARAKLCNKYNMTVVQDMQLAFDKERQQYTHSGMTIVSKLEPSLDGVGDAKTITRSMHLVIGLFNPSRYDLVQYPIPPKEDPEACYRIDVLGNRFRALKIIKSNDSDVGMRIGLMFNALAETFEELPLPKTPEIKGVYQQLTKHTGSSFVSLTQNSTFAAEPAEAEEDDDELPFG